MIVHGAEIEKTQGTVTLSAPVEFHQEIPDVPNRVWYRFPSKYLEFVSDGSEAFAAALILVAMLWGEDCEVRGRVSPKFAYGLHEYVKVFHLWAPDTFRHVNLKFEQVGAANSRPQPSGVATAFSGGVDSTFTLRAHLPDNLPIEGAQVTHGIFIHGFDVNLDEEAAYRTAFQKFAQLYKSLGLELIPVTTNVRLFSQYRQDWVIMSGGPLISAGLALDGLLRRYYIPSGYSYHEVLPNGNSPLVDHLLSTESLEIVHHGAHKRHFEKMDAIADWEVAHRNLRVCITEHKPMHGENCSACNKCLANMVRFELLGVHDKFVTFEQPFSWRIFPRWWLIGHIGTPTIREIMRLAISKHRWDIYAGMLGVRLGSFLNRWGRKIVSGLLSEERFYQLKRTIYENKRYRKIAGLFA